MAAKKVRTFILNVSYL